MRWLVRLLATAVLIGGLTAAMSAGFARGRVTGNDIPGSELVYAVWANGGASPRLYEANADGTHERRLSTLGVAAFPDVSPDGRRIAYQAGVGTGPIVVMNIDGTSSHVVAARGQDAAWSPDGQQIAYWVPASGIWSVREDGSGRRRLVNGQTDGRSGLNAAHLYTWTSTNEIVYLCRFGPDKVCAVRSDGAKRRLLTGYVGSPTGIRYSPDGSRVAYVAGSGRVYVMNLDGRHRRRLPPHVDFKNTDCGVAWSPDGKRIVFSPKLGGSLYTINVTTGGVLKLRGTSGGACGAAWR